MKWLKEILNFFKALKKTIEELDKASTKPSPTTPSTPTDTTTPTTPEVPSTPETPAENGEKYVIKKDERIEKRLSVPCSVSFDLTGKEPAVEDGSEKDNLHIAWAYEKEWNGGNTEVGGGFIAGVRDYAIKVYDRDGHYSGQQRYQINWQPMITYKCKLEILNDEVRWFVDGLLMAQQDCMCPSNVTVGLGWPPSRRPGALDATLTNIKWREWDAK